MSEFSKTFLSESVEILLKIDTSLLEKLALELSLLKSEGRLFILGVGGSASHASHAVNDFRKICNIEAYCPTDNVSELTARTNDEGWGSVFSEWLKTSKINSKDALLIFSVGGGDKERNVSTNLISAMDLAKKRGAKIFSIVGRQGGYASKTSDICVLIPDLFQNHITPHTEGIAAVLWHLLVSHPVLQENKTRWESIKP